MTTPIPYTTITAAPWQPALGIPGEVVEGLRDIDQGNPGGGYRSWQREGLMMSAVRLLFSSSNSPMGAVIRAATWSRWSSNL